MAFLAIPAVASYLGGGALGTAAASALSGAALGAAASEASGGDWESGALKGALGAGGGALFSGLLGGAGAAAEGVGEAASGAASVGSDMGAMAAGSAPAATVASDLSAMAIPTTEELVAQAVPELAKETADSALQQFLADSARNGATNVVSQKLMAAATPQEDIRVPVKPLPPIVIPPDGLEQLLRNRLQLPQLTLT